ncbi:8487c1ce-72cc-4f57-a869-747ead95b90d-CDS [Sclerotinia trifoliorum]|uniref:8487c1ce-72cc-4f57-a869-747ead95b90d-CDS n=1 Tax=Sclerotinia trifoliorum TaxID=28548 RepID=A0A8H2ZNV0_9HELO|nr:8487c1ce-72cc-4f57-a869-747ead95b90d-CDS [Sclerotinia trifoliorum]
MKPKENKEFKRKLEEACKAFTTYGVTHEDPKLDNAIDIGDRVIIIDLEQCIIEDTNWKGSMNKARVGYLMDSLQLKRQCEDEAKQREKKILQENAERIRLRNLASSNRRMAIN